MSDKQHESSQPTPVERIPLAELYQALPDYVSGAEEPFDIQAGFTQLQTWIDEQEADAVQQPLRRDTTVDVVPDDVQIHDHRVAWLKVKDTDFTLALAEIERRRVALDEQALRHTQEMEVIRHRDKIEVERAQLQVEAKLRTRAQAGRLIVQTIAVLTISVGFILSIISNVVQATFALSALVTVYALIVLAAGTAAMRSPDKRRRHDAERILRFMLFR